MGKDCITKQKVEEFCKSTKTINKLVFKENNVSNMKYISIQQGKVVGNRDLEYCVFSK